MITKSILISIREYKYSRIPEYLPLKYNSANFFFLSVVVIVVVVYLL